MATTEAAPTSNKTWRLTMYEVNRVPQEIISSDIEIKVSPRSLHSELMCPICLDMLKNTMTTKECLHRFCQECITTALRSGNKECPTCRKKLVSRRSLRRDPTFDELIAKIYPNRAEYEAHQERVLAKLTKNHSQDALMNSIEEGMRMQALLRQHKKQKRMPEIEEPLPAPELQVPSTEIEEPIATAVLPDSPATLTESSAATAAKRGRPTVPAASTSSPVPQPSEIELVFYPRPCPTHEKDETRYIKTTDNATVEHLKKYLAMRMQLDSDKQEAGDAKYEENMFSVSIQLGEENYTDLQDSTTLKHVNSKMWKQNKPLELYFARTV
ncbi:E3 ubiquitin-protein ligase RING2-A-like isoform X2 [Watersipora subatra]|uniref:E3 ubiquitin-protein ligase RING2-A-like isoform X2 n=1 Tax=Watersipora subatra TaxID=2589382 RepID=UPI00355BD5AA